MSTRYSYMDVKSFVEGDNGDGCILLSNEYKNTRSKLRVKCKCGEEFETTFANFKHQNKRQCNKCGLMIKSNRFKLTYNDVKRFIEVESNSNCKLLSEEYKNNRQKLRIQCKCGGMFITTFNKFKQSNKIQCNQCASISGHRLQTKTNNEFIKEVYDLVGEEYTFLEEYIDAKTKIKCKHNICQHEFKITPNNFLKGRRCSLCFKNHNKTTHIFKQEVHDLVGSEYEVIGEYVNAKTKILMLHNCCDYSYYTVPNKFLNGNRCPQCAESKGENDIRLFLDSKNIKYKREYSFYDLLGLGGKELRFDFAVFNGSNELGLLIEYDGIFHYEKQYMDDGFEAIQIHDEYKNNYCKKNNIRLLRIPYWEFENINNILIDGVELIKDVQLQ